ncbi:MAG TPA: MCE family protein, partial [Solirubrobacteraceae bacterium]|nr:MCE family protein [Solirubrobacteraceae bacterium]
WLQGQAAAVNGRGQDISDALGNLSPFAQDTTRALEILNSQRGAVRALVRNTGDVFAALSERDGQLRGLIENSNRVFATTARRSRELAQAFVVLPTFEREATTTVHRVTRFASNANPLVSQLRPAARQLSPTLKNLSALAPDLRALFRDINPLIDASKKGLPALQQFLDDLRPLLGQLDPFLRNVNPVLTELTRYKRELNAFFSNTVAATEATDKPPKASAPVHYLRTTNPINPETLALSPTRLATDRYNPYIFPNEFDRLGDHLRVYDDRSCGAGGVPALGPASALFPQGLKDLVNQFALGGGQALAPPCELQPKFPGIRDNTDQSTRYPQVRAQPAP